MATTYHITDIRNLALAGHGASGKTSLADALLFTAGALNRKGSVDDGTSALDVDEEEKRRHFTIDCHLGHLAWGGKQIHLIDTPGYPDFIGNALSALAAVENVVLAVSASGIEVNTRRLFQERVSSASAGLSWSPRWTPRMSIIVPTSSRFANSSAPSACRSTCRWARPAFSGVIDVIQSHEEDPPIARSLPARPTGWSSSRSSSSTRK